MGFEALIPVGETLASALGRMRGALTGAGIEAAGGDARRLMAAAIGGVGAELIRDPRRTLSAAEARRLNGYITRRLLREPVSRILGEREFYGRPFALTPDVLDPRADTETLIDTALEIGAREGWYKRPIRILDIGTGSGAILLTLLAEFPLATGVGIDVSVPALACAEINASALGVAARCRFNCTDVRAVSLRGTDLVVSNPPYIPSAEIDTLAPEVAVYDPRPALDGGSDGLMFYRWIFAAATRQQLVAKAPQWLVLECGAGQSNAIVAIAWENGFSCRPDELLQRRDLGSILRCVALQTRFVTDVENPLE